MLQINSLQKKYGNCYAVNDLSYTFGPGIYGILGPNGAGKTTLLGMIMGAVHPDHGQILYNEIPIVKNRGNFISKVGYLPQNPIFYKDFPADEFLAYICELKDIPKAERSAQIATVLEEANLADAAKKKIGAYSGGMRQRLGIAQALIGDPEMLIFDEPTAGLDPIERIRFRNTISRLSADRTIIITTHIVPDVEFIAQTIVLMNHGKIILSGNPNELIREVQGKVWTLSVNYQDVDRLIENYKISNIQLFDGLYTLRIVSDLAPDEHAEMAKPKLEEAYIYFTEGAEHESANL
jgi:ABC-2 type transport system ATP-binding protein